MSQDKVRLPSRLIRAIENTQSIAKRPKELVIKIATQAELYSGDSEDCDVLKDYAENHFDTLLTALAIGWEVEQTPEDKVREYFLKLKQEDAKWTAGRSSNSSPYGYELTGCVRTLNLLGINVEGVNA